jgi:hypothetical protein
MRQDLPPLPERKRHADLRCDFFGPLRQESVLSL